MSNPRSSNSPRHSRSLEELEDVLKRAVGFPEQCIGEITADDIREFVLDSLAIVSDYKPQILEKTITVSGRSGVIVATGRFYGSDWVVGDEDPEEVPRQDVQCYLGVSPAISVHGNTQSILNTEPFNYGFGFPRANGGVVLDGATSLSSNILLNSMFDNFLDFQLIQQNIQAGMSMSSREFYWEQDYNNRNAVWFTNLPSNVSRLTIRVAISRKLGSTFYLPPVNGSTGDSVIAHDEKIDGNILRYTHDLALGKIMKKVGMIRTKIQGGINQFQLNGDTMLQEGNLLEERTLEKLGSSGDLWGTYNDNY